MKAKRVIETCLYAVDLQAAEEFYTRVLGLEVFAKADGRHVFFRVEGAVFLVFNPEQTSKPGDNDLGAHGAFGQGHAAFAMGEKEVDSWRQALEAEGVPIELEYRWPNGGFSLYFRDPAGNSLELVTPKTWGLR